MVDLEDAFASEVQRQGRTPTREVMTELAIHFAGSKFDGEFVVMPSGNSIHIRDAIRSICVKDQPEALPDQEDPPQSATLTERMRQEINKHRSRTLPTDWLVKRSQVTGLTAEMMDERATERQGKN